MSGLDILGGGLRSVFSKALGPVLKPATLHVATTGPDGKGGTAVTFADQYTKGFVDQYTADYRARAGIPDTDVKLMILQHGLTAPLTVDCQVTIQGKRYAVAGGVEQDPGKVTWTFRGRPL